MLVDANQCYTRHLALRGRARARHARSVPFFEEPLLDRRRRRARVPGRASSTSASRPARTCTRAGTSCPSSRSRRDPRGAGRRVALRRHQRGEADLRPRRRHHLHAIPHTFSDALTIAANLHVVAASSNAPIIEYDRTYNPIQTAARHEPAAGRTTASSTLPTGPGLGVEIDWDFVADHPYTGEIGIGAGSRPGLRPGGPRSIARVACDAATVACGDALSAR